MSRKYLDPKNDLTFKRIFGEHKHLCMSLLNNLLKFEGDSRIKSLEYQTPELLPELDILKHSIVDVKCLDEAGRTFIVEIQLYWSNSFRARTLLNTAKTYSRQLDSAKKYSDLRPVFSLCLVNDVIETDDELSGKYYWEYGIREKYHDKHIPGFDFVFIELPKFKPVNPAHKTMFDLWLSLLTQVDESTDEIPRELLENEKTKEAIKYLREGAYTRAQMQAYDGFKDMSMIEVSVRHDAEMKGEAKGIAKGREKTLEEIMELIKQGVTVTEETLKKLSKK
ncbi:MAG: Rpn family recombination-promoting nuclease/putative transposase [Chitinispirillales bacterium]|jgi:predicted transposase/invertase (TIGR01784 family)|nr:Rpn family recombination-promoting nuclease/putative transposase [Chitinispirillales bacterium]